MKWYVINVRVRSEEKVKEMINKTVKKEKLEDYIGEIFVPIVEIMENKDGLRRKKKVNLTPGYVFLELDMNKTVQNFIKNVSKNYGFLKNGSKPLEVDDIEIKRMKDTMRDKKVVVKLDNLKKGTKVKIKEGPFIGFDGEITGVKNNKCKVNVLIFGRLTSVEISSEQLEVML